jgi:DNA-3-methyladenine glycosylase II
MTTENGIKYLKQADPILANVIETVDMFELAHPENIDLLTALAQAIIYQQISTQVAQKIFQRFLQLYQQSNFPLTGQTLLETPEEMLRSVGISRYKVRYLKDAAQKIIEGFPTLSELGKMDDETVIKTLIQIKGVGLWTAQMLLIFHLDRPDVLPANDLGIRSAIAKLYSLNSLPDAKTIDQIGQKWKPYRSIASRYLWRSL